MIDVSPLNGINTIQGFTYRFDLRTGYVRLLKARGALSHFISLQAQSLVSRCVYLYFSRTGERYFYIGSV